MKSAARSRLPALLLAAAAALPAGAVELKLDSPVSAAAFSRDGRRISVAGSDRSLLVYDAGSGRFEGAFELPAAALSTAFSTDGGTVAAGMENGEILLLDLRGGRAAAAKSTVFLRGHSAAVASLAFHPGAQELVSASGREVLRWDAASGNLLQRLAGPGRVAAEGALGGGAGGRAGPLWYYPARPTAGGSSGPAAPESAPFQEAFLAYCPGPAVVAVRGPAGDLSLVRLGRAGTPPERGRFAPEPARQVYAASLSRDCSMLAVNGPGEGPRSPASRRSELWDARASKLLGSVEAGGPIEALLLSPDGARLAAVLAGNRLAVWETALLRRAAAPAPASAGASRGLGEGRTPAPGKPAAASKDGGAAPAASPGEETRESPAASRLFMGRKFLWGLAALFVLQIPLALAAGRLRGWFKELGREDLPGAVRKALPRSPEEAYKLFKRYHDLGGSAEVFSAEEIFLLYVRSGHGHELAASPPPLTERQLIGVALRLDEEGRAQEAAQLLSRDPWLFNSEPLAESAEAVIRVFQKAGALRALINDHCAGKPPHFALALARAFLRLEMPAECGSLLQARGPRTSPESRLLAEVLAKSGREDEALRVLEGMSPAEWTKEDHISAFRLSLRTGRLELAERIFPRMRRLVPMPEAPELYREFASAAENAGRLPLAEEVCRQLIADDAADKDVIERYARLKAAPDPVTQAPGAPPAGASGEGRRPPFPKGRPLPGLIAGRYELRGEIGEGGMGIVAEGFDRKLGRKVALKRMRPEIKANPKMYRRFLDEARIVSRLSHPFIVGVHEVLEEEGELYLVFDFVDGKTLSRVIAEKGRLDLASCKEAFRYVCEGVDAAHRSRVLHRDLKPSNIMIETSGYVKVMDFGLARAAKETVSTVTGTEAIGTPAYMAPEQHAGKASVKSDVYCLGVCLYEALTGQLPYNGPDFLAQKKEMGFPPPQFLAPGLPASLEGLMRSSLAPDPMNRCGSVEELYGMIKALPGGS